MNPEFFSVEINRKYLQDGGKYYVGTLLEYNVGKKRTSKICKIWEIDAGSQERITEWIDDPDLKNKETKI